MPCTTVFILATFFAFGVATGVQAEQAEEADARGTPQVVPSESAKGQWHRRGGGCFNGGNTSG